MTSDRFAVFRPISLALGLCLALANGIAAAEPLRFQALETGPGQAVLEVQAEELVTMTVIPFRLHFRDETGQPVTGARVTCELTMPSMSMPENRPRITATGHDYTGEMILTCTMGDWRMTCIAEEDGGVRRTATFDIGTARMK